jgi:[ribosomal protein S5]-alanine N-acetyltransferase
MSRDPVFCRPFIESDITDRYLTWFRDPEVTRFIEARNLSRDDVEVFHKCGRGIWRFMDAICSSETDEHIGNVKIDVNWRHSFGSLSILIGNKAYWGRGCASSAIRQMTEKAFKQLGVRTLTAGAYGVNFASLACFERAGWALDTVQKGHLLFEDRVVDQINLCIFNPGSWRTVAPSQPFPGYGP